MLAKRVPNETLNVSYFVEYLLYVLLREKRYYSIPLFTFYFF